jgi:hypothetical protein
MPKDSDLDAVFKQVIFPKGHPKFILTEPRMFSRERGNTSSKINKP